MGLKPNFLSDFAAWCSGCTSIPSVHGGIEVVVGRQGEQTTELCKGKYTCLL
jgi:hypothetical protein